MEKTTIAFIGCGNMGSALARGILASTTLSERFAVLAYDLDPQKSAALSERGASVVSSPEEAAQKAELLLLAVKPYQVEGVIEQMYPYLSHKILLSIAGGVRLSTLRTYVSDKCPCVQIMPNTPAMVGEGLFGICLDDPTLPGERKEQLLELFKGLGRVFPLPENRMNAFSAVAGCGPAYVFQLMDAIMEGAVTLGFTRREAAEMVGGLFSGSARLMLETGRHPMELHSCVTSPGGQTIAGTNHMARTAIRGHLIDAVLAAFARGKEMEEGN